MLQMLHTIYTYTRIIFLDLQEKPIIFGNMVWIHYLCDKFSIYEPILPIYQTTTIREPVLNSLTWQSYYIPIAKR